MDNINNNESVVTTENLLKRAYIFLEDGNWPMADKYFDYCLDREPEMAEAYLGKMFASYRLRRVEELENLYEPFDVHPLYHRIIKYADNELKAKLDSYLSQIKNRRDTSYKDSIISNAKSLMSYNNAQSYRDAIGLLETIKGWRDADSLKHECEKAIDDIQKKEEEARKEKELLKEKRKKTAIRSLIIAVVSVIVIYSVVDFSIKNTYYKEAVAAIEEGNYLDAHVLFSAHGSFRDSEEYLIIAKKGIKYEEALSLLESDDEIVNHTEAYKILKELGDFEDAEKYLSDFRQMLCLETVTNDYGEDYTITYDYNKMGLLTKKTSDKKYGLGTRMYEYDSDGKLICEYRNTKEWADDYSYYENGNVKLIEYTYSIDTDRNRQNRINITFDENGVPVSKKTISGDTYSFDCICSDGSVTRLICKDVNWNGEVNYEAEFDFDSSYGKVSFYFKTDSYHLVVRCEKGKKVTEYFISNTYPDGFRLNDYRTIEYDDNGNEVNINDKLNSRVYDYTYDEEGLLTRCVRTDKNGEKTIFEYTYGYIYAPEGK